MLLQNTADFTGAFEVGFRAYSTGALPSTWTLDSLSDATPRDIAIQTDTVNVCWEPDTALFAPEALYTAHRIADPYYFRLRMSLRVHSTSTHSTVIVDNVDDPRIPSAIPILIMLTGGDVLGSGQSDVSIKLNGNATRSAFAVTTNKWYRFIYERANRRHSLFGDKIAYASPNITVNDEDMPFILSVDESGTSTVDVAVLYAGWASSNTGVSSSDYSGISDFLLEEFKGRARSPSSGFAVLSSPDDTPYTRYKNMRQAQLIYNNLVLGA